jgi:hypothetical protein
MRTSVEAAAPTVNAPAGEWRHCAGFLVSSFALMPITLTDPAEVDVTLRGPAPSHLWRPGVNMKRTFVIVLGAGAAMAVFAGLVHAVLVGANASEPAATTVYGLTLRRLWATTAAFLAFVGAGIGALALARPGSRFGTWSGPRGAVLALGSGLIAALNGGLNLAVANGGPGTGNGVVGGAAAVVLGLLAVAAGGLALARSRRAVFERGRMT